MNTGLAGKVAVITGATANIGRAIALDFAAEGAKLVLVGRDEPAGERVVERALEQGARAAVFVAADLLDQASPARIIDAAEQLGPIDVPHPRNPGCRDRAERRAHPCSRCAPNAHRAGTQPTREVASS